MDSGTVIFSKPGIAMQPNPRRHDQIPGQLSIRRTEEGCVLVEWAPIHEATPCKFQGASDEEEGATVLSLDDSAPPPRGLESPKPEGFSCDVQEMKSIRRVAPTFGMPFAIITKTNGTNAPPLHFPNPRMLDAFLTEVQKNSQLSRAHDDPNLFVSLVAVVAPPPQSPSPPPVSVPPLSPSDAISPGARGFSESPSGAAPTAPSTPPLLPVSIIPVVAPTPVSISTSTPAPAEPPLSTASDAEFEVLAATEVEKRKIFGPLDSVQWEQMLDVDGRIVDLQRFKEYVFYGGVHPDLRPQVWKFLLGYYPLDSTAQERAQTKEEKVSTYFRLKRQWMSIIPEQERRFSLYRDRRYSIEKDLDDKEHQYLRKLSDILVTYSFYNFDLGYVQGMSDLLAPLLVVMGGDEVDAFWLFAGLMERMEPNFATDQSGLFAQLERVGSLVRIASPPLARHLAEVGADNYFFCFRWCLLHFKREFAYTDVMRLWEAIWTDHLTPHFVECCCATILLGQAPAILGTRMHSDEILRHMNGLALKLSLPALLRDAVDLFLRLAPLLDAHLAPKPEPAPVESTTPASLEALSPPLSGLDAMLGFALPAATTAATSAAPTLKPPSTTRSGAAGRAATTTPTGRAATPTEGARRTQRIEALQRLRQAYSLSPTGAAPPPPQGAAPAPAPPPTVTILAPLLPPLGSAF
ncbi:putative TBC1 domain family member 15 [Paratrimastix pyriformis]|uniref:TBC1 domain family member 15 n=1 Tax=Paratrimastix pyriformis TaxID=342808 RepID=A0ABQ8UHC4_9EUKA|nr:putative TBC1 domain family member 15 [Paratrimastix pyriformis]